MGIQKLSPQQWKAINSILLCRTPALGGELHGCPKCEYRQKRYHSCRNRHCPVCQGDAARKWIEKQKDKLLPVAYFHVVFSLPEELNPVFQYNRSLLYNLFFQTGSETLQGFFEDPRHLGAKGGFFGVLHTWGQQMQFHPHIHWVVPAGGINGKGQWVKPRRPDSEKFLFPVKALSEVFRGKFLEKLEKLYAKGKLSFPDPQSETGFRDRLSMAGAKKWNIYAKAPFAGPEQVIEYLARYTHRIAISPRRIKHVGEKTVTFEYKDYRAGGQKKQSTVEGELFLRRFVMHVLPRGFRKIRDYGWMRGEVIKPLRQRLLAWFAKQAEFARRLTGILCGSEEPDACGTPACPKCEEGLLEFLRRLLPERIEASPGYG